MSDQYQIYQYGRMAEYGPRMEAHAGALRQAIRPGAKVLDLGAGTGVMSLLACRFGAGRVVAVEPSSAAHVAKANVVENGLQDRIEVYRGLSTQLPDDSAFDVIVADLRSVLPLHGRHFETIVDARSRLLRPGGTLIPERDRLFVAGAGHRDGYEPEIWRVEDYGLSMHASRRLASQEARRVSIDSEGVLLKGDGWFVIDYATIEPGPVLGSKSWTVEKDGVLREFVLWFETDLLQDHGFTTAPASEASPYGQLALPLPDAVEVRAGDQVDVSLRAQLLNEDYVWSWRGSVIREGSKDPIATFQQSEAFSALETAPGAFLDGMVDVVPRLSDEGRAFRVAFEVLESGVTLDRAMREIRERCLELGLPVLGNRRVVALAKKFGEVARPLERL